MTGTLRSASAREVLDPRGNPAIEAVELQNGDAAWYAGKGVPCGVANVNKLIAPPRVGENAPDARTLERMRIKGNQAGTLGGTMDTIGPAKADGHTAVNSRRSGETEHSLIADLAAAARAGQIKAGSDSRTDSVCTCIPLPRIEEEIENQARLIGIQLF